MNKDEAFTRGANAFYKGEKRIPYLDPSLHPFINQGSPGSDIHIYRAWLKGWDKANLDCKESDMAEHDATAKAEALNEQIIVHGQWYADPQAEKDEAHARWVEDLEYKQRIKKELEQAAVKDPDGITFNKDGSVTMSADWIKRNAEKDRNNG